MLMPLLPPTLVDPSVPFVIPKSPPKFCALPSFARVIPASSENCSASCVAFTPSDFPPLAAAAGFSPFAAAASASAPARAASPSARPGWDSVPAPPDEAGLGFAVPSAAASRSAMPVAGLDALGAAAPAAAVLFFPPLPPIFRPPPLMPPSGPPRVRPPMESCRRCIVGV